MDRFHLVCDVIDRVPGLAERAASVRQAMVDKRAEHKRYINEHGIDMPEILHWKWKCGSKLIQPDQSPDSTL
jgi:xylulose-5-phosphate/fructose-6-phosphate phosphoketolase